MWCRTTIEAVMRTHPHVGTAFGATRRSPRKRAKHIEPIKTNSKRYYDGSTIGNSVGPQLSIEGTFLLHWG